MNFSIKQIVFVAVMVLVTVGVTRYCTPADIIYQTAEQQQQLDSLTVALQNVRLDRSRILDEARETSAGFQQRLTAKDEQIASYTRVIGQLNLKVDSLQRDVEVPLDDLLSDDRATLRDTTLRAVSTYGDSLFAAVATAGIRDGSLFLSPPSIEQLRPVRLDLAVTLTGERRVTSLATSPDFADMKVEAFTELAPPRRRLPWFWIGLGSGILISQALL